MSAQTGSALYQEDVQVTDVRWIYICLKVQGTAPGLWAKLYISDKPIAPAANGRLGVV